VVDTEIDEEFVTRKIRQVEVDFEKLMDDKDYDASLWKGHTHGFTCMGLYTGAEEKQWIRVEIDYNVKIASLLKAGGTQRYAYLSGQGVVEGGDSMFQFAKIKGKAEGDIRAVGFDYFSTFRPGGIYGRPAELQVYSYEPLMGHIQSVFGTVLGCSCDDIGKAMIFAALVMADPPKIIENSDIKKLSGKFDEQWQ